MIQLLSWNTSFLVKDELLRWKNWFISKHWDIGVTHIIGSSFELQTLRDTLHSRSFFTQKKLLILEDISLSSEDTEELFEILKQKDDDTIVLIVLYSVDKRLSNYKALTKLATEHKDFSLQDTVWALWYLRKQYGTYFSWNTLEYLFELKGNKLEKTISEIHKLLEVYESITKTIIDENIAPELDSSIFRLIDYILQKDIKNFQSEIQLLLEKENFYLISQALLSNLRNNLYIEYLKEHTSLSHISDILELWKKSFLITKRHNTSYKELSELYRWLIRFDCSMKQGKLWVSGEDEQKILYRWVFLWYFSKSRSFW